MSNRPQLVHCPLCGMEFDRHDALCCHGCPMGQSCDLSRCPNCEYEFPAEARSLAWLRRLFRRRPRRSELPPHAPMALERLLPGEHGKLIRLSCEDPGRRNTLTVFGLVPGAEITLVQRQPSYVVRVGETELGLDEEIARQILVQVA